MKVALVCDWFHPRVGGLELHLQDLAAHLRAANHDVVIITPTPGAALVNGTPVVRIDALRAPHFGFLITPGGIRAIGRALDRECVDVAHCHVSIVSPAALGGAWQAVQRAVPTVLTFHSVVSETQLLARAADAVLGTSQWPARFSAVSDRVAREVRPIARDQPMTILPNGVDAGFWRPAATRQLQTATVELISVMRLNSKKRPLVLVQMMRQLARLLAPSQNARLRILGDGPQRARMEREIARRGLTDRILLLGAQSREQVRELLASSDLFVLPTVRESFGLAALEARCVGLPVVAMRASGVAEIIAHGREGLLASSDDELALHVAELALDSARRARIAAHNRDTRPQHDWPKVLEQHMAIYREAIALRASV